jgi:hypothetical protein
VYIERNFMKTASLIAAGLIVVAGLSAQTASARIINESYYPPGEDYAQQTSIASRAEVKAQTRLANMQIEARQPRREFGAGSHDTSPQVFTREQVKSEAKTFERVGAHVPFSY